MNRFFVYYFGSEDDLCITKEHFCELTSLRDSSKTASEIRDQAGEYLSCQASVETYADTFGFLHEIHEGNDQLYAYYFVVSDNVWQPRLEFFQKCFSSSEYMPEQIRCAFKKLYDACVEQERTEWVRIGDSLVSIRPRGIELREVTDSFDSLEYDCFDLFKRYCEILDIKLWDGENGEDAMDFGTAKKIQSFILSLLEEYGCWFYKDSSLVSMREEIGILKPLC